MEPILSVAVPAPTDSGAAITRSLIIPVYRNEANMADLIAALTSLDETLGGGLEVVFVIDGSPDMSGAILAEALPRLPFPAKLAFHSRNFGSFAAVRTGLELAEGDVIAGMAADLQEPPELIVSFFDLLQRDEADIVLGVRNRRADPPLTALLSNMFWWAYRRFVQPAMPRGGVDVFACNAKVRDVLLTIAEPNSSLIAQLFWVGFRRKFVAYDRRARTKGRSGWSWSRRLRYMFDSIISFSDLPILALLWVGAFGCVVSVLLGIATAIGRIAGVIAEPGYTSLLLTVLFFGSAILVAQGIIGCYVWRAFENTKNRPLQIVTQVIKAPGHRQAAMETAGSGAPDHAS